MAIYFYVPNIDGDGSFSSSMSSILKKSSDTHSLEFSIMSTSTVYCPIRRAMLLTKTFEGVSKRHQLMHANFIWSVNKAAWSTLSPTTLK
jgi:hypothetical protein